MSYKFICNKNNGQLLKYFLVSCVSAIVDFIVYWIFYTKQIINQAFAGTLGYIAGLFLAYFLLKKYVFIAMKDKKYEKILFIFSGAIGSLATYTVIVFCQTFFHGDAHFSKIFAMAVSFTIVYIFRKYYVFR